MENDKKNIGGELNFILLDKLGNAIIKPNFNKINQRGSRHIMNILVINGPNLNLLGEREPSLYGKESLDELMKWLENSPEISNNNFKFYQSNYEGGIIDCLHDERHWAQGIIINAGALSHYSYAIMDAPEIS